MIDAMTERLPENPALEYIHVASIGSRELISGVSGRTRESLERFYAERRIVGVRYLIIHRQEMIGGHFILKDIAKAAGNVFPIAYLCLQHHAVEDSGVTAWARESGFVEVTE